MCASLETTSEVTDDQEEMINFYQQNKLVQSHWLVTHRRRSYAPWSQVLQLWWTNEHCTSFLLLVFFIDMHWRDKPFQNTWKKFWNT